MSINGNQFYVSTDIDPMIVDDINDIFKYEENGDVSFTCNIKTPSTCEGAYKFTGKSMEHICRQLVISVLLLHDIVHDFKCSAASNCKTIESYRLKTQMLEKDNAKYRAILDKYIFSIDKEKRRMIDNDDEFVALMTHHGLSVRDLHILHDQYRSLHSLRKVYASNALEKFNDPKCQYAPLPDIVAYYRKEKDE